MRRLIVLTALALPAAFAACGGDADEPAGPAAQPAASAPEPAPPKTAPAPPPLRPATCPSGMANCRSAGGRILYVEAVDPDGDGDAHFVLLSRESITAPGLSIIDVRADLRPHPLPRPGDRISAAGPVFSGSRGQKQIEAVVVHTAG